MKQPAQNLEDITMPVHKAASILESGGLVAFPTETVYGLGADATNPAAVARIFEAKGRPLFNPLISHVASINAALELGQFNEAALKLAHAFWPGPMTLVVPFKFNARVCDLARAGLNTIAVRVPAHPLAHQLLAAFGRPVVAPSANRSGHVSPTTAAHVCEDLGQVVDLILDGGPTVFGLESSIFACLDNEVILLRPGSITRQMAEKALGHSIDDLASPNDAKPIAPGQLASHYAPRAQMRLDVHAPNAGEAFLAFGPQNAPQALALENLSPDGNLSEAAANLYAMLRRLDASGAAVIAVAPIPSIGLGEAIRDRLNRAAAPR